MIAKNTKPVCHLKNILKEFSYLFSSRRAPGEEKKLTKTRSTKPQQE
jgi:hypothetical protein